MSLNMRETDKESESERERERERESKCVRAMSLKMNASWHIDVYG